VARRFTAAASGLLPESALEFAEKRGFGTSAAKASKEKERFYRSAKSAAPPKIEFFHQTL